MIQLLNLTKLSQLPNRPIVKITAVGLHRLLFILLLAPSRDGLAEFGGVGGVTIYLIGIKVINKMTKVVRTSLTRIAL